MEQLRITNATTPRANSPSPSDDGTASIAMIQNCAFRENDMVHVYAEIMEICHPFCALPQSVGSGKFYIPPRLEDGLFEDQPEQDNPQDAMTVCYQDISSNFPKPPLDQTCRDRFQ
jgi:hypothetical protein